MESKDNLMPYDQFVKARIKLIKKMPFFGRLSLLLELLERKYIPTAGTDGSNLYYNADFVKKLSPNQVEGLLMHEVLHIALGHLWRRDNRNFHLWNIAADFVVNQIVVDDANDIPNASSRPELPQGALLDAKFRDQTAEQIYDYLLKNAKQVKMSSCQMLEGSGDSGQGDSEGEGSGEDKDEDKDGDQEGQGSGGKKKDKEKQSKGGSGDEDQKEKEEENDGDGSGNDDKPQKEKKPSKGKSKGKSQSDGECEVCKSHADWNLDPRSKEVKNIQAQVASMISEYQKTKGNIPAGLQRMVEEMKPKENWRAILLAYLSESKSDFDFMRRDRRTLDMPFYFPDLASVESLEDVVVTVDTSGSIDSEELNTFIAEVRGILKTFQNCRGWLIECDAEIGDFVEIKKAKHKEHFTGGGGTSHVPIFKEIEKRNIRPKVMLCFTDLYTDFPSKKPNYPVLWLATPNASNTVPPFGRVIKLHNRIGGENR